jgi:hypothetical protein
METKSLLNVYFDRIKKRCFRLKQSTFASRVAQDSSLYLLVFTRHSSIMMRVIGLLSLCLAFVHVQSASRECIDPNAVRVSSESFTSESRPLNHSLSALLLDPLRCVCKDGYRLEASFGLCVRDECESQCGQSDCTFDDNNPFDSTTICHCPAGFVLTLHPEGYRCTPILRLQALMGQFADYDLENPLLARKLQCEHVYRLHAIAEDQPTNDPDQYEHRCACWPGYKLRADHRTCEQITSFECEAPACNERQICVLSPETQQPTCRCRIGFEGVDCSISYCDITSQTNVTALRLEHVKLSISNVCHTQTCEQNGSSAELNCKCPYGRYDLDKDGLCQLRRVCQPNSVELEECSARQAFCVPNNLFKGYECQCPESMPFTDNEQRRCSARPAAPQDEIRYQLTRTDENGCLAGLVDPQKHIKNNGEERLCEPAAVTFDLRLRVLLDLTNKKVFENVYEDAIDIGLFYRCMFWHASDAEECVNFKRELVARNIRQLQPIGLWKSKLIQSVRRGFVLALTGACPAEHVHIIDMEVDGKDPMSAMREWSWLHLQVSCSEHTNERRIWQVLRARLLDNKVDGLLYLQDTVFIDPETVL